MENTKDEVKRYSRCLTPRVIICVLAAAIPTALVVAAWPSWGRAAAATPEELLSESVDTPYFRIRSNLAIDLDALAALADAARSATLSALGGSSCHHTPRVPVYVCATSADVVAIERYYGVASADYAERSSVFGGYYHDVPMIAISVPPHRVHEIVAHEIAHSVVEHRAPTCPALLNEGIAMHVVERVLARSEAPDGALATYMKAWRRACGHTDIKEATLRAMTRLSVPSDGRRAHESEFYVTGWCLVRALMSIDKDKLGSLVESAAVSESAWAVLAELYDVPVVLRETRRQVRHLAGDDTER